MTDSPETLQTLLSAARAERDALEGDLASARETIEAVRKRAEAAEKERDVATGRAEDHHTEIDCQVCMELQKECDTALARCAELELELKNTESALIVVKGLQQTTSSRVEALEGAMGDVWVLAVREPAITRREDDAATLVRLCRGVGIMGPRAALSSRTETTASSSVPADEADCPHASREGRRCLDCGDYADEPGAAQEENP